MGDSYYLEEPENIEWTDIVRVVQPYMSVWNHSSELGWGKYAWHALGPAGLTKYQNEAERTICVVRALALAAMTKDFYARAFGEGSDGDWRDEISDDVIGADPLIDAFTLGQIAERKGYETDHLALNDSVLSELIVDLIEEVYQEVGGTLRYALGDAELFASMFAARESGVSFPVADDYVASVVNDDVTADKLEAYEWLTTFEST